MPEKRKAKFREGELMAKEFRKTLSRVLKLPKEEVARIKEEVKAPKRKNKD